MKKLFETAVMFILLSLPFQNIMANSYFLSSLDAIPDKIISKEVKKLKKEGWKVSVGAEPLEMQFLLARQKESETGEDGFPKYYSVTVTSKDIDYDKARSKALEFAKIRIANTLPSNVDSSAEIKITNEDRSSKESRSVTEFVETGRVNVSHRISNLEILWECWRQLSDGTYEVMMSVALQTCR